MSKVVAIRFTDEQYERLYLRAFKQKVSVGKYLKSFINNDLYRKRK